MSVVRPFKQMRLSLQMKILDRVFGPAPPETFDPALIRALKSVDDAKREFHKARAASISSALGLLRAKSNGKL